MNNVDRLTERHRTCNLAGEGIALLPRWRLSRIGVKWHEERIGTKRLYLERFVRLLDNLP